MPFAWMVETVVTGHLALMANSGKHAHDRTVIPWDYGVSP